MRLPADARFAGLAVGLSAVALAGCSLIAGDHARPAALAAAPQAAPATGPAADYPVVLGDPFTVDGQVYTPADTLNYDAVGYAGVDEGAGVTVAHRTLPLPSYVEVTSLATGKTILARVERRGPMTGSQLIALSPAAAAQLGGGEGTPVRVRRVNPQEALRAELRAGRPAPEPIETPKSLVEVLRRKLPANGAAVLGAPAPAKLAQAAAPVAAPAPSAVPPAAIPPHEPPSVAIAAVPAASPVPALVHATPKVVTAFPLAPLHANAAIAPDPTALHRGQAAVVAPSVSPPKLQPAAAPAPKPAAEARAAAGQGGGFVVQAGTFSSRANAKRVADALDGYVSSSGKYFRVRTGPFTSRGQAEAALAKVRAAGYSDARVYTAG